MKFRYGMVSSDKVRFCVVAMNLILSFFAATPAQAIHTLEDFKKLAQENNPTVKAAVDTLKSAQEQMSSSRSGFLPKLSASASGSRSTLSATTTDSYAAQLTMSQNLFSGFSDQTKVEQAQINFEISKAQLDLARNKSDSDVKTALAQYQYGLDFEKLADQVLKRRSTNLNNVELRFQNGRENKGSVLLSTAYLEQAKLDQISANHQKDLARNALENLVGENSLADGSIPSIAASDVASFTNLDVQDSVVHTPDYLIATKTIDSARADIATAKVGFFPSLDLSGSLGKSDSIFFPSQDKTSIQLTLSVPLFDGGRDYYAVKSATTKLSSAEFKRTDSINQLEQSIRQSVYDYKEAIQKEKVDRSFKEAAEVRAQIARSKYNNGLMTFEEWDLVETDLITRERTWIASKRDLVIKGANLEKLTGVIK